LSQRGRAEAAEPRGGTGALAGDAALPPHPSRPQAIGIDIGGTKIAAGVVTADGHIIEDVVSPTPMDDDPATLSAMLAAIKELRGRHPGVEAIGIGAAGLVDWPSGRVRWAPHNAYRQLPLRRLLYEATGLPTVVDNDANAAAWAEARFGAGAGSEHMVLLTVGTGIGGGLVLGGQVYRGGSGLGAEVGHMIVDPHGHACACGNIGCLETVASGDALGRSGREAARADPGGLLAQLAGVPGKVTGEVVFRAAREGDPAALELFQRLGFWLGVGIASLVNLFDPELVVVGGGLVATGNLLLAPARASLERYTFGLQHRELPPVVPARLGPEAGMVGAASLALRPGG
jgi:glucokinase